MQRFFAFLAFVAFVAIPTALSAQEIWTAVIPDAFPGKIYTWRLAPGGTYREDGSNALSGKAIQQTLSGRWRQEGRRMILTQNSWGYVFDGTIAGKNYNGVLFMDGRKISRFCALRGNLPPRECGDLSV
jgi:hypothetical protein